VNQIQNQTCQDPYARTSTNKPIKKNHFDLIVCFEVLEHIKNEKKIIEFFFKSLKKGGSLILSVPSKNAPLYRAGLLKNFDLIVGHLRRYTKNEITNVLTWGGFKIDTIFFEESILRNLFYTTPLMGNIIRFIKGPLVHLFFAIDKVLVKLFGESDLIIIGVK
jgi:SAM-dependent methyltransferase